MLNMPVDYWHNPGRTHEHVLRERRGDPEFAGDLLYRRREARLCVSVCVSEARILRRSVYPTTLHLANANTLAGMHRSPSHRLDLGSHPPVEV